MRMVNGTIMELNEYNEIRKAYNKDVMKNIFISHPRPWAVYSIYDWKFTPIEYNVWCNIRYFGLPFYPQFPVLKYFIDFADPVLKIAIEVDSKKYHNNEKASIKDKKRDEELKRTGWRIIRIPSYMTYTNKQDYEDDYENEEGIKDFNEEKYKAYCSESIFEELAIKIYR